MSTSTAVAFSQQTPTRTSELVAREYGEMARPVDWSKRVLETGDGGTTRNDRYLDDRLPAVSEVFELILSMETDVQATDAVARSRTTDHPHPTPSLIPVSSTYSASELYLGPGVAVSPKPTVSGKMYSPSPIPEPTPIDEQHQDQDADTQNHDPYPYPAPIGKLVILSVIFFSIIGLTIGVALICNAKRVRAYLRPKSLKQPDEESNASSEKFKPTARNSALPPWLRLPSQIPNRPTIPDRTKVPRVPPPLLPVHADITNRDRGHRRKVIDITPEFPRSRFSDSSYADSLGSDSSIEEREPDLDAAPMVVREEDARTSIRRSGVPLMAAEEFFSLPSTSESLGRSLSRHERRSSAPVFGHGRSSFADWEAGLNVEEQRRMVSRSGSARRSRSVSGV